MAAEKSALGGGEKKREREKRLNIIYPLRWPRLTPNNVPHSIHYGQPDLHVVPLRGGSLVAAPPLGERQDESPYGYNASEYRAEFSDMTDVGEGGCVS